MNEKRAFLFPGQASQYVGMAKDLCEHFAVAREMFQAANDELGFDIQKICFAGPLEELTKTSITQPAILIHSAIVTCILKKEKGILPAATAGHSLGEYSALFAAEALSFEDALRLVKLRGELMQQAGVERPGTMAAIIGMPPQEVAAVCEEVTAQLATQQLVVQPANFNSPEQTVISGSVAAVDRAMQMAKERGAKLAKRLVVGGAFHSPLMAAARAGLQNGLASTTIRDAKFPVYANVTAKPETRADCLRDLLAQQLTSPVRWSSTIENMLADGVQSFWEVGPGNVLAGLLKRINRSFIATTIGKVEELREVLN
jgi:[acyl-carrier-protein] S-malonyltransferase